MRLHKLELSGFKSFAKKANFVFTSPITAIVGPNGSGKSNTVEAVRWVLGERSFKSLRGKKGEDLIWSGAGSQSNRAAVTLAFENHDRKFPLDYDEVVIGREVYRDGTNNYLINGSVVRYRDVVELLNAVSLGTSAHSIISQGEADRVLTASDRERRLMLEEALGLRQYQWKIEDSEKKLEKTEENVSRVESLRREIAPHLRFLKKQVEKIERADALRKELVALYPHYLQQEERYLSSHREQIQGDKHTIERALHAAQTELGKLAILATAPDEASETKLNSLAEQIRQIAQHKDELSRRLGRLEGLMEGVVARPLVAEVSVSMEEVRGLVRQLQSELEQGEQSHDVEIFKQIFARLKAHLHHFMSARDGHSDAVDSGRLEQLRQEQQALEQELGEVLRRQSELEQEQRETREQVAAQQVRDQAARVEQLELSAKQQQLQLQLDTIRVRSEQLELEETNFKQEIAAGVALVGEMIKDYRHYPVVLVANEPRTAQIERQRHIERLKIKLEDFGGELGDTMKEYQEATERDQFLERELADLKASANSLRELIKELQTKVDHDFRHGLAQVSGFFEQFIKTMFGGGTASLHLVKTKVSPAEGESELLVEAPVVEEVVEIKLALPRKKARDLSLLSGGERALVSIALLFAMSQVNPPPFLILDETDAALDEANSRKYGDILEMLAKHCQLVLVTHNRETMSRAGVIYGVTMGGDGVSQLLSIKLDDAVGFAK